MLRVEAVEPLLWLGAGEMRLRGLHLREEESQMARAAGLRLTAFPQPLAGVLAHGLQQPVAAPSLLILLVHNQRLPDQPRKQVQNFRLADGGHRLPSPVSGATVG